MPLSDLERRAQRSSGASLFLVVAAVACTAAVGAFLKRQKPPSSEILPGPIPHEEIELQEVDRGIGQPPAAGSPKSVAWFKLQLLINGTPNRYRPIQFKRKAVDASGKVFTVDQVWSGGYLYLYVRKGYRTSEGPVNLSLSFRGKPVFTRELSPLPQPQRVLPTRMETPELAKLQVVRLLHYTGKSELGLRVEAPGLKTDEGVVVKRLESTYSADESEGTSYYAALGNDQSEGTLPLRVAYPDDIESVRVQLTRVRAQSEKRRLTFHVQYGGKTNHVHQFSLVREFNPWAGGVYLAVSRDNRSVAVADSGNEPLTLLLNSVQVQEHARIRLISPARIHGVPCRVRSLIRRNDPGPQTPFEATGNATPRPGDLVPIELEVELGIYQPVRQERVVIPVNARTAPTVKITNRPSRPYNLEAWLPAPARPVSR